MFPPNDPTVDPLGLPPAPQAPTPPPLAQPKGMHPAARAIMAAVAALAGPGRGTGILQGLNIADQRAKQEAFQQNQQIAQDFSRREQAYRADQQMWEMQQQRRTQALQRALQDFQTELGNTSTDAEAENLYQTAGSVLSSQGFRGFDADSLKRKYKSPDMIARATKTLNAFLKNPINAKALENDPEAVGRATITVNGVPMTVAETQALIGGVAPTAKPKPAPTGSPTIHQGVMNGKPSFFTVGPDNVPTAIQGVTPTPPAASSANNGGPASSVRIEPGTPEYQVAKDLASGALTFSGFRTLSAYSRDVGRKTAIYALARQLNSEFNPADFELGYRMAGNPQIRQRIVAINALYPVIDKVKTLAQQVGNGGAPAWNRVLNGARFQLGNQRVTNLRQMQTLLGDEVGNALGVGTASDLKTRLGLDLVNTDLSAENFASTMDQLATVLSQRRDELAKGMGPYADVARGAAESAVKPPASNAPEDAAARARALYRAREGK